MSWLDFPPCDIISSLNTINAAIIERNSYMSPSTDTDYYRFDFLPRPCSKFAVLGKMRDTLYNLKILYQEHFPVKNFGCWGHWRPYENVEGISLENAIAAELTEVGINSNAVLLKYPMRYSDVDFVRGCYYLLNNVLLYSTYNIGALRGQHLHREWSSEEAYDRENPSVDEIVENLVDGHGCVGMSGYYKSSLNSDINTHFIQYYTNGKYIYAPELRGDWKAHYTVQIYKYLSYPRYDDVQIYGEKYDVPGIKEINFSGSKSEVIPYLDDIIRDLTYYQTWGNYKYGYAYSSQVNTITEVFLTLENFPVPNYKYLD